MKDFKRRVILQNLAITAILFIGAFLRLYKLDKVPSGFYVDEAAIGYNSYSILLTGKDEYGYAFPVFLRSYGAYSSPLYMYISTIPVLIWGLNIFSIRLLSAVSGVLSTFVLFLILKKIKLFKSKSISYVGAFLFTISPWSIFFSRGAFEANFALLILGLVIYFILLSEKNIRYLILSSLLLSVSTYAYQANRLIAFLLLPGVLLILIGSMDVRKYLRREVILVVGVFMLVQIPQLLLVSTPAFKSRATGLFYSQEILTQAVKTSSVLGQPLSLALSFIRAFFSRFTSYFSPRNLFFEPDPDLQRSIPELSVFYFWMALPYIIGLFSLLKRYKSKHSQLTFLMLFVFASVVSLTGDPFSSLRSLPLIFPLMIVICIGIDRLVDKYEKPVFIGGALVIIFSILLLWRSYFVLFPSERAKVWGYGFDKLAGVVKSMPVSNFVIDQSRIKPAYIELAFYLKYPPEQFHKIVDQSIRENYYNKTEFNSYYKFANLETRNINWEEDVCKKQILVGDELSISESQAKEHFLTKMFEIKDPVDQVVFVGYKTNPENKCKSIGFNNSLYVE